MFFPGVRRRSSRVPHAVVPFGLAICSIALTLLGWAIFAPSRAGLEFNLHPYPDIASIGSIAYTVPGEHFDDVVVRSAVEGSAPRVIATFPSSGSTGYHVHGAASPLGDRLAVVSLPSFVSRAHANLSLVDIASGEVSTIDGMFDYFTRVSWAPDGMRFAAVRLSAGTGEKTQTVVQVDLETGTTRDVASFTDALDVVPVGYSFDSARLFVVVVDQRGSNLYVERGGKLQIESELSPGRTMDWALSPDGSRLAFVDILAGGSRTYVGRTLTTATGAVTSLPATADQLGASWVPGSPLPTFGGPGGGLQLSEPANAGAYVIPGSWSPNASFLVANVFTGAVDPGGEPGRSLELVNATSREGPSVRTVLSEDADTAFLGWVRNLN